MLLCLEQRARSGRVLARRALPQLAHYVRATCYAYPWPDQPEYASVCDGPPPPSTHATAVDVRAPLSDLYGHVNPRAGVCASLTYRTRSSVARGGPGRAWRGLIPRVFKRFGRKVKNRRTAGNGPTHFQTRTSHQDRRLLLTFEPARAAGTQNVSILK